MKFGVRDVGKTIASNRTKEGPGDEAPVLPSSSLASSASDFTDPEKVSRSARQRLLAGGVACYYAQRRFSKTGRDADRRIRESCQQETQKALTAVRGAERVPAT